MPKGVLWRQHDIFMAAMGGRKVGTWEIVTSYEGITERLAESVPLKLMLLPPLMHGAAQWAAFMLMAQGATIVFPDDTRRVDPDDVWSTVEREGANTMSVVGDAVLRPLLRPARQEELRPVLVLRRGQRRGATDPGRAGHGARAPAQPRHLRLGRLVGDRGADARHLRRRRRGRDVPARAGHRRRRRVAVARAGAGHEGNGWLAQTGSVPLGYLGDPTRRRAPSP